MAALQFALNSLDEKMLSIQTFLAVGPVRMGYRDRQVTFEIDKNRKTAAGARMDYTGMRWLKCDLQVQTPADAAHWRGAPGVDQVAARRFIARCYEVGLDCIAITDHNFASRNFFPLLVEANHAMAGELGRKPIHIFAGFEIEADIGKGVHALAVFDSDLSIEAIDHRLTECGVPFPRFQNGAAQASRKNLREILSIVQTRRDNGRLEGMVICPHIQGNNGLFDNDAIAEWLQREEWINSDLLAVEIPKPVEQMRPNWRSLFRNGDDCLPDWKRIRPIGRFMSSDCKGLTDAECRENYLGKRYCWVKMSSPSVESLRQAALDHESRVWFGESAPEVLHTRIVSMTIRGVRYLQDQQIHFSPHLNCIIGGRGSGKSTILEYLRMALRAFPPNFSEKSETAAAKQHRRIASTLTADSAIDVRIIHGAVEDGVRMQGPQRKGNVVGRTVANADAVFQQFGVLAFSQEEITEMAAGSTFLSLIDDVAGPRLAEVRQQEATLKEELRVLLAHRRSAEVLSAELAGAQQNLSEIKRQFDASAQLQGELRALQQAEEDAAFAAKLVAIASDVDHQLEAVAASVEVARTKLLEVRTEPEGEEAGAAPLTTMRARLDAGLAVLQQSIRAAQSQFDAAVVLQPESPEVASFNQRTKDARDALQKACESHGISPAAVAQLHELAARQAELLKSIESLRRRHGEAADKAATISEARTRLSAVWDERAQVRREEMQRILDSPTMPRTRSGHAILNVSVKRGGNLENFLSQWTRHAPDRRSKLGRAWDDADGQKGIGHTVFDAFHEEVPHGNPIWWLDARLDNPDLPLPEPADGLRVELKAFREANKDAWESLMLTWFDDSGDIELLRSDGSTAGSIANKDLSDGQRNTAILSLLLARGQGPVLIDQPESELDTAFLFTELVPMLRQSKATRQLIVVTHNANIPVNADAEMIYALEPLEGRGVLKTTGGLDTEEVTQAVIDIMEGSADAFRKRHEKYHF